jgi:hypothetical protein
MVRNKETIQPNLPGLGLKAKEEKPKAEKPKAEKPPKVEEDKYYTVKQGTSLYSGPLGLDSTEFLGVAPLNLLTSPFSGSVTHAGITSLHVHCIRSSDKTPTVWDNENFWVALAGKNRKGFRR